MANWIGARTLLRKENRRFLKVWRQTVLAPMVSALLYFIVFAPLFSDRLIQGTPYLVFIAPGLVMMGIIMNSFSNSSSSLIISKYQNTIVDLLMYPMTGFELMLGYVLSGMFRGVLVGVATLIPVLFFLDIPFSAPLYMVLATVLVSFIFSALGVIAGLWSKEFDQIALVQNFLITPLVFLGGVFFSAQNLPEAWRAVAFWNPVSHMVDVLRYGMIGVADFSPLGSLVFLICVAFFLGAIAVSLLGKGKWIKA